jgi:hypothetical protein
MKKFYENYYRVLFLIFFSLLIITGCEKKGDQVQGQRADTTQTPIVDSSSTLSKAEKQKIPDLTGNWKGTFDQRSATMSIIKQNGEKFEGVMNINYRQPLHKTINGTLDIQNNTIKMNDLEDSQYAGQYTAQLLNEGKTINGTFILTRSGKAYNYNFQKQ